MENKTKVWLWVRRMDWRVRAIFVTLFVQVVATSVIYYLGIWRDPSTHVGAVFAAWVGGLALFVVSGAVIAVISIARPEHESFDNRARILFKRKTGTHIDYIITRIKEIVEHYAESTVIKITLKSYDTGLYRISVTHDLIVRSYLDDIVSTYNSSIAYTDMTLPPNGGEPNKLVFVRVDENPIGDSEEFTSSIERKINTKIDKNKTCSISTMVEFWTKANDEPNDHTPKRFTQALTLQIENHLPNPPIKIKLVTDGNCNELSIPHGQCKQILSLTDVPAGQEAFTYHILAP